MNYKELTEKWHKYLKKEYWADINERDPLEDMSEKITDHKNLETFIMLVRQFHQMVVWCLLSIKWVILIY